MSDLPRSGLSRSDPPRVLLHNAQTASLEAMLRARVPDVVMGTCTTYADLPAALDRVRPDVVYTVRFGGSKGYPKDALLGAGGPRWIANGGAGTDHLGQWETTRTTVTNAAGAAAEMMAEYIIGGFLHFTLDVPGLQADKAARIWAEQRTVRPLKGATLLVVGLGHTGRAVASRAKAFGMTVIGTRARPVEMTDVDEVHPAEALTDLLPRADFIAVSTPLTPRTRGLLDATCFARMKPGVVLADVSRGGVIEPAALLAALQSGHVAGAALDVFEQEPLPQDSPFWRVENALISPHCSAVHADWERLSFEIFLDNLDRWQSGAPLINVVDPARGY